MTDEILTLIQLQDTDQAMAAVRATIAALPAKLAALESKLAAHKTAVEQSEKAIKDEEVKRRSMERDLKDIRQKIAKLREQSSSVKTNDQFHALQNEIGYAEAEVSKIEDGELESMERSDVLAAQLAASRQDLADQAKVVDLEQVSARKIQAEQEQRLVALDAERALLRKQVDEARLSVYDRVAGSRGTGLARVVDGTCTGCRMALRPQLWNQVRGGELTPCESCGRMLYFDNEHAPDAEPAPTKLRNKAVAGA